MHIKYISNEQFNILPVNTIPSNCKAIKLPHGNKIIEIKWLTPTKTFLKYKALIVNNNSIYAKYINFSTNQSSVYIIYNNTISIKFTEYEVVLSGLKNLGSTCYFNAFMQMMFYNNLTLKKIKHKLALNETDFSVDMGLFSNSKNKYIILLNEVFKGMINNTLYEPNPMDLIPWNRFKAQDFSFYLNFVFSKIRKEIPEYNTKIIYALLFSCGCKEEIIKNVYEIEVETLKSTSNNSYFLFEIIQNELNLTDNLLNKTLSKKINALTNKDELNGEFDLDFNHLSVDNEVRENTALKTEIFNHQSKLTDSNKEESFSENKCTNTSVENNVFMLHESLKKALTKNIENKCSKHKQPIKHINYSVMNEGILLIKVKREENGKKILNNFTYPNTFVLNSNTYELIGVVFHEGGVSDGHYYYICKVNDIFYKFNDDKVSKCNLEEVFYFDSYSKENDLVSYYIVYINRSNKSTNDSLRNNTVINSNKLINNNTIITFDTEENNSSNNSTKVSNDNNKINNSINESNDDNKYNDTKYNDNSNKIDYENDSSFEIDLAGSESTDKIELEEITSDKLEFEEFTTKSNSSTEEDCFYKFTREDIPKFIAPFLFNSDYPSVQLKKFYCSNTPDKYSYKFKVTENVTEYLNDLRYENKCIIYEILSDSPFLVDNERKKLNIRGNNIINHNKSNESDKGLLSSTSTSDNQSNTNNSTWEKNTSFKKLYFLLKICKEGCPFLFPRKLHFLNHVLLSHEDLSNLNYYKISHNGIIKVCNNLNNKINLIIDNYFIIISEEKEDYLELKNKFINNKCIKIEENVLFLGRNIKVNELNKIIQRVFLSSSIEIDWDGSLVSKKKHKNNKINKKQIISGIPISEEESNNPTGVFYSTSKNFLTCKSKENILVEINDKSIEGINQLKIIKKNTHSIIKIGFIDNESNNVLDCNKVEHIHYIYVKNDISLRGVLNKLSVLSCINKVNKSIKSIINSNRIELLSLDDKILPEEGMMLLLFNETDSNYLPCVYYNDNKFIGYPFLIDVNGLINIGEMKMKYSISNYAFWNDLTLAEESDTFKGMLYLIDE